MTKPNPTARLHIDGVNKPIHRKTLTGPNTNARVYTRTRESTASPKQNSSSDGSIKKTTLGLAKSVPSTSNNQNAKQQATCRNFRTGDLLWDENMAALRSYKEKYGTTNVPKKCKDFPDLAKWVENLRRRSIRTFPPKKLDQLQEIGFTWFESHFEEFDRHWEKMFSKLMKFRAVHGHCRVPIESKEDPELGNWVKNQRALYRKGTLPEDRQKRLEDDGFEWKVKDAKTYKNPSPKFEKLWRQRYEELIQFQQKNGHCKCPKNYPPCPKLGDWVHNQRTAFAKGLLREDRQELLDEIGFCWSPDPKRNERKKGKIPPKKTLRDL